VELVENIYRQGIRKMKNLICNDGDLRQIKKHIYSQHHKVSVMDGCPEAGTNDILEASEGESCSEEL
jgi:hypothetical protein